MGIPCVHTNSRWILCQAHFVVVVGFFLFVLIWTFPGQGSNPHHSSDLSPCSNSAGCLTHCATRHRQALKFYRKATESWDLDIPPGTTHTMRATDEEFWLAMLGRLHPTLYTHWRQSICQTESWRNHFKVLWLKNFQIWICWMASVDLKVQWNGPLPKNICLHLGLSRSMPD